MKKYIAVSASIAGLLVATSAVYATPNTDRVPATNDKSGRGVIIPEHAVQVADNVFSLGSTIDPDSGRQVDGYMIVHPRTSGKKPDGTPGGGKGGNGGATSSSCYGFLAKDAKWKTVEPWVVDPSNPEGLNEAEVFALLDGAITKWEDAADGVVDGSVSINILGAGSVDSGFLQAGDMDGVNGVTFGDYDAGVIGVTSVWGIFGGPPGGRELVEWDQIYNTDFTWATDGNPNDMDFDSIATHELGHSVGLADLYTADCADETMYGYGSEGETKARDLNAGDIAGISKLY